MQPAQRFYAAPNPENVKNTHRISYLEWGDQANPNVAFCVHGLTRNAHDFDFISENLAAAGYRVIAPDMTGRGDSEYLPNPVHYNYPVYMADCLALISHLKLPPVLWIGTSMGGIIGMMIAAFHPDRITKLVLNDIGSLVPKAGLERIVAYVSAVPASFSSRAEAEAQMRRSFVSFGIKEDGHWQHLFRHSIQQRFNGQYALAFDPRLLIPIQQQPVQDVDLSALWKAIKRPVLIIRGSESDILLRETAQSMLAANPDAQLVEFDGIGHAPMLMEGAQIDAVQNWLQPASRAVLADQAKNLQ